jgi:hypothetical protein
MAFIIRSKRVPYRTWLAFGHVYFGFGFTRDINAGKRFNTRAEAEIEATRHINSYDIIEIV